MDLDFVIECVLVQIDLDEHLIWKLWSVGHDYSTAIIHSNKEADLKEEEFIAKLSPC